MWFEALTSHGLISTVRHFFFTILPRKVHYLFSYFEKSGKKIGHPQKKLFDTPLKREIQQWINHGITYIANKVTVKHKE